MKLAANALVRRALATVLVLAGFAACAERGATGPGASDPPVVEGPLTELAVTATNPSFGRRSDVGLQVAITGAGFAEGAQATWTRDGLDDPDVIVRATQFVSSTQLIVTIDIAAAARLTFYGVRVRQPRRRGIGTESVVAPDLFEVTQAIAVAGAAGVMRGVNDNGEMTGNGGPLYWSAATGLLPVDVIPAAGFAINPAGSAVVANGFPRLYTRPGPAGTPWQLAMLPADSGAVEGGAHAMLADSVTGDIALIAGRMRMPAPGGAVWSRPRVWLRQAGTGSWQMLALPTGTNDQGSVRGISADSIIVGALGEVVGSGIASNTSQAAIWQPDGAGGWSLTTLAPVPSAAEGINRAGTLIVGAAGGLAAYWERGPGGAWSGPITLPGGCTDGRAVDNFARIVVHGCSYATGNPAAVLVPPYSTATMVHLGGLGKGNFAFIEGMSPSGAWIVGNAGGTGSYWRPF